LVSENVKDLIELAEQKASCELYAILKRDDEKVVTERAYDNPVRITKAESITPPMVYIKRHEVKKTESDFIVDARKTIANIITQQMQGYHMLFR
jgi:hypothetical protein